MSSVARPVGGKFLTPVTWFFIVLALIGGAFTLARFVFGLGATTAMSDGYPWGLWIAFDVVTGTALACGGYSVAILAYVFNKGKYHPLVRPAVLTSALGYSVAAVAIIIDVGRYWNIWKIPVRVDKWNLNSGLLEVALCVMSYVFVLWIEISPVFMERFKESGHGVLARLSTAILPVLEKVLPFILALGILLPTMHQSSLGSLYLIAWPKLHLLWHTPLLPLLYIISVVGMGYAVVVFEATFSSRVYRRERETAILGSIGNVTAWLTLVYLAIRIVDIALRGRLGLVFRFDGYGLLFLLEFASFLAAAVVLIGRKARVSPATQVGGALLMMWAGSLYRFDTYLVAYRPGPGWSYFPSVGEQAITIGLVALEVLVYVYFVKRFPILSGAPSASASR